MSIFPDSADMANDILSPAQALAELDELIRVLANPLPRAEWAESLARYARLRAILAREIVLT